MIKFPEPEITFEKIGKSMAKWSQEDLDEYDRLTDLEDKALAKGEATKFAKYDAKIDAIYRKYEGGIE